MNIIETVTPMAEAGGFHVEWLYQSKGQHFSARGARGGKGRFQEEIQELRGGLLGKMVRLGHIDPYEGKPMVFETTVMRCEVPPAGGDAPAGD